MTQWYLSSKSKEPEQILLSILIWCFSGFTRPLPILIYKIHKASVSDTIRHIHPDNVHTYLYTVYKHNYRMNIYNVFKTCLSELLIHTETQYQYHSSWSLSEQTKIDMFSFSNILEGKIKHSVVVFSFQIFGGNLCFMYNCIFIMTWIF